MKAKVLTFGNVNFWLNIFSNQVVILQSAECLLYGNVKALHLCLLPGIVAERKFITVSMQMFRRHLMIDTRYSAFQMRPKIFNRIGMYKSIPHVFTVSVIDYMMLMRCFQRCVHPR